MVKLIGRVGSIEEYKIERLVTRITTETNQESQGRQGKDLDEM